MIAKIALFALGDNVFALRVEEVGHIVFAPRVFSLPLMRKGFAGVFLYQSGVIPLLDLWQTFGEKAPVCGTGDLFTVVNGTGSGFVGLPASQVLSMVNTELGILDAGTDDDYPADSAGIFVWEGRRYPLLDIEKLVNSLPP